MRTTLLKRLLVLLSFVVIVVLAVTSCFPPVNSETPDDGKENSPVDPFAGYETITIAEALELCTEESGYISTERYYIRGTIKNMVNAQYGNMVIEDETGTISIYGTYSSDGELSYPELEYQPVKGDEVLLHCILQNFNGTKEVKNARLIAYKNNQGKQDISAYTPATIAQARASEENDKVLVEGVVARITYASGLKPIGYILVDGTASIYVYDADSAQRVSIGNKVKLAGSKDYWILENEIAGAEKFGYGGCNQLTNVILVENDNGNNAFDKSWITESTVKDVLDTPVTEDITTLIYKVNALVKKVPGDGFVNYYFFDIDGETGSYAYTQANGNDFTWLDQFDGKICTVYLTALNAKSSSTGCYFRLLPVAVEDNGYTFNPADAPAYAIKYHALGQFNTKYTGNPNMEVITSVSSTLLGIENVTVSYTSSDDSVMTFTTKDDKVYFECPGSGSATVTITATYGNYTASETVSIQGINLDNLSYVDVQTAINTQKDEMVTVRGIVGPSLVNRDGFYLIDETGMIAIIVNDTAIFQTIEIGHEVVITGKRDLFHNGKGDWAGQIALTGAIVEANLYGNNEYNTSFFITDKTLADFYALNANDQHSNEVYVLKAVVTVERAEKYSKIYLTLGATQVTLYSSGANQYEFLLAYENQEVTVELAPCNWNNKKFWAGCVLAVYTEDGKVVNPYNFDKY